ncbi:flavin reductase family protein [Cupriavidus necator]|uniref:Flavin reductase like domain-containing protein n=1 Tax=Cupriavidus pinatubonensis (strain JMP 134 / LMG 1197) TaxID=264198 RepID=Q46ML5_CUPPJ|nr:flavin reductase family protein [Cupriavidus necator]
MRNTDTYSYLVRDGHDLVHDPVPGILGPRPIGWISTCDSSGRPRLQTYSFFGIFNYVPPIVGFASVGGTESVNNAELTGEFAYNLATRPLAGCVNQTIVPALTEMDEFERSGLTKIRSIAIAAPRVAESPVSLECRVTSIQQLNGLDSEALNTWLVLGEVVAVHINRELLCDGFYDTVAAQPILRGGGACDYFEVLQAGKFRMTHPR